MNEFSPKRSDKISKVHCAQNTIERDLPETKILNVSFERSIYPSRASIKNLEHFIKM